MRFVVHDKRTGAIIRQGVVPETPDDPAPHLRQVFGDNEVASIIPKGVQVDDGKHMVDLATGAIVDRPAPTPEEAAASALAALRWRRSRLLASTDWTQMPDAPMPAATRAAYATYRQALRDWPATPDQPVPALVLPPKE